MLGWGRGSKERVEGRGRELDTDFTTPGNDLTEVPVLNTVPVRPCPLTKYLTYDLYVSGGGGGRGQNQKPR